MQKKSLSLNEKYWRIFWKEKKSGEWTSRQKKKGSTEGVTGLGRRTREEIVKWNQMTGLRFQKEEGGRVRDKISSAFRGGKFWWINPRQRLFSFLFLFNGGDQLAHTNSALLAKISPQWLSELKRLWPSVPWRTAYELVSLLGPMLCLDSIVSPFRLR